MINEFWKINEEEQERNTLRKLQVKAHKIAATTPPARELSHSNLLRFGILAA